MQAKIVVNTMLLLVGALQKTFISFALQLKFPSEKLRYRGKPPDGETLSPFLFRLGYSGNQG